MKGEIFDNRLAQKKEGMGDGGSFKSTQTLEVLTWGGERPGTRGAPDRTTKRGKNISLSIDFRGMD